MKNYRIKDEDGFNKVVTEEPSITRIGGTFEEFKDKCNNHDKKLIHDKTVYDDFVATPILSRYGSVSGWDVIPYVNFNGDTTKII